MRGKKLSIGLSAVFAISTVTPFVLGTHAAAQTEKVLHSFELGAKPGGSGPEGNLIFDAAGNLYGTTFCGGTYANDECANNYQGYGSDGSGTVFELIPKPGGEWTEKVLHNFGSGKDGAGPTGGMILDAAGNLYGTTLWGGTNGYGTAFELMPKADGSWTEKVLYSFCSQSQCADGSEPFASLVFDRAGNLYGTTYVGGAYQFLNGTVFELSPQGNGDWTEKVLHKFAGPPDGAFPQGGLILDDAGNLYGTTAVGGSRICDYKMGCGTVYELSPNGGGGWKETLLYVFEGSEESFGAEPNSTLIFDAAGNLYGTASGGPAFELLPQAGGGWVFEELPVPCCDPNGVTIDAAGNLYGTSWASAGDHCCGSAWELSPQAGGNWVETVLYTFPGSGKDGAYPLSGLIRDAAGNLYGTTSQGGSFWTVANSGEPSGTVFEITP
jgi:uncharacterized repeat protein (TIGR03803 family)